MIEKPVIDFNEELHQYSIGDQIVPSVSQILGATIFKNKYANVDRTVLANKAQFGTNVHNAIEHEDATGLTPEEQHCYMQWLLIQQKHEIEAHAKETMVAFWNERTNTWDYCGTFDLIATFGGKFGIGDYKTTAVLDRVYLSWQMSFYGLPIKKFPHWFADIIGDNEIESYNGIWLPKKRSGKMVTVAMKDDEEIYDLLEMYYEMHPRKYIGQKERYKRKRFRRL